MENDPPKPFQYTIRTLLIITTALALLLGLVVMPIVHYMRKPNYPVTVPPQRQDFTVVPRAQRWSEELSKPVESWPLSKSTPDTTTSLKKIDPNKPWKIGLARGSTWHGYDCATLQSDGPVELLRMTFAPPGRTQTWETTKIMLPRSSLSSLLAAIDPDVLELQKEYHANVADGTQWMFFATQGQSAKSTFFDNHFPYPIVHFADALDNILAGNGVDSVKWQAVTQEQADKFQKQFWDSIEK
jgi:hypothetical protein